MSPSSTKHYEIIFLLRFQTLGLSVIFEEDAIVHGVHFVSRHWHDVCPLLWNWSFDLTRPHTELHWSLDLFLGRSGAVSGHRAFVFDAYDFVGLGLSGYSTSWALLYGGFLGLGFLTHLRSSVE